VVTAQAPDDDGDETVTDRAVILPLDVEPLTVTQLPAATEEAATLAVWAKTWRWSR
jgi:hypothetical protein